MLKVLKLDQRNEWDTIVKNFKIHDSHYLSAYAAAFSLNDGEEALLFYYQDDEIRAINSVIQRDLAYAEAFKKLLKPRQYYDLISPYGYGGFLVEGELTEASLGRLNAVYVDYCQKKRIVSEFVKFHPLLGNATDNATLYDLTTVGETVYMPLTSASQIWEDLSSARRRVIRKAQKNGVDVHWGNSPDLLEAFIPLYEETMRRDQASDFFFFSQEFYQTLIHESRHHLIFFYATYQGEIISIAMFLMENQHMQYFLSGSNRDYHHLSPASAVIYEAAWWGQVNGYQSLHLGGGQPSLLKYKQGFTRTEGLVFQTGRKVFDDEAYNYLVSLRKNDSEFSSVELNDTTDFFPKYRI